MSRLTISILAVVVVAGIVAAAWKPLTERFTANRVYCEYSVTRDGRPETIRGWRDHDRQSGEMLRKHYWWLRTGMKCEELDERGSAHWNPDGSVNDRPTRRAGAKRWEVTAQLEPSMPEWMKDQERWRRALERSQ